MGFRIALENAEQCQVNGTAGECHTDTHIQNVHQHIGQTSQHAVYSIHQRSHKQEGEFQRLGDAGNHRSQCCGEQQASNHLFLFRTSRTVHGKCRSRQTEDHERELTGHKACCRNGKFCGRLGCQFCEEDVLRTGNHVAVDHHGTAQFRLPERHIEHVMQSERDQRTFQNTIDPCTGVTGVKNQCTQMRDAGLYDRPEIEHDNAHDQINHGRNDRDKACAAEEGQHLGQFNFVEPVVQCSNAQSHQDTAEHTHLQCGDAQHGSGEIRCHCLNAAFGGDQRTDGSVHDQVSNCAGKRCNFFFLFRHADGNAHGKQQRQVIEHGTACLAHDIQNGVEQSALVNDIAQMIGLNGRGVGKGTSQTQQKSSHGQQRNGEHKRAPHSLQYAENLVFHYKSPPKNVLYLYAEIITQVPVAMKSSVFQRDSLIFFR